MLLRHEISRWFCLGCAPGTHCLVHAQDSARAGQLPCRSAQAYVDNNNSDRRSPDITNLARWRPAIFGARHALLRPPHVCLFAGSARHRGATKGRELFPSITILYQLLALFRPRTLYSTRPGNLATDRHHPASNQPIPHINLPNVTEPVIEPEGQRASNRWWLEQSQFRCAA